MAIPDYQACMLPILEELADGQELQMRELTLRISDRFELTEEERQELLPSGQTTTITSRVGWAKTYLKKAELLEQPKRGMVRIADNGKQVLAEHPERIDRRFLEKFPSYAEFWAKSTQKRRNKTEAVEALPEEPQTQTPDELLDESYQALRDALADEILEQVKSCSPAFFERLVVELLVAMGYGGSIEDAGQAVGRSGDGGIDGIIKEDKLGLDIVVIQAKKWDSNSVGRPAVQAFAGSMEPHRAKKGVFITTSSFSSQALEYVTQIERKIVLIDGPALADLMIDYNIGVSSFRSFELKRLDSDYFED